MQTEYSSGTRIAGKLIQEEPEYVADRSLHWSRAFRNAWSIWLRELWSKLPFLGVTLDRFRTKSKPPRWLRWSRIKQSSITALQDKTWGKGRKTKIFARYVTKQRVWILVQSPFLAFINRQEWAQKSTFSMSFARLFAKSGWSSVISHGAVFEGAHNLIKNLYSLFSK